ncbi:MAG: hypothetical protein WDN08_07390 [Rhizomicrobium sp.]
MRIVHFEDEWAGVRSIAHWLHDRVFQALSPAEQVELELKEEENSKEKVVAKITVFLKIKGIQHQVFEYLFVTDLDILNELVTKDDIVVVDIMRSDKKGRFVSILRELEPIYHRDGFDKESWRYFSNYPEKIADTSELQGFMKKQFKELVEYLFEKVWSDWKRQ